MTSSRHPLIFLDVDGPLIPIGAPPSNQPIGPDEGNPLLVRLDRRQGDRLLALGGELAWATSWMQDANEEISPRLGLPQLGVVHWPDDSSDDAEGLHWKTRTLVAWAAGRAFVWIDDEVSDVDRDWVRRHHPGPALLHRVDRRLGLTEADFATIAGWLAAALGSPATPQAEPGSRAKTRPSAS